MTTETAIRNKKFGHESRVQILALINRKVQNILSWQLVTFTVISKWREMPPSVGKCDWFSLTQHLRLLVELIVM